MLISFMLLAASVLRTEMSTRSAFVSAGRFPGCRFPAWCHPQPFYFISHSFILTPSSCDWKNRCDVSAPLGTVRVSRTSFLAQ
jgi:hypothetical protein